MPKVDKFFNIAWIVRGRDCEKNIFTGHASTVGANSTLTADFAHACALSARACAQHKS
jgi:hypothetical protein